MRCPRCRKEVAPGSRFCNHCAAPLPTSEAAARGEESSAPEPFEPPPDEYEDFEGQAPEPAREPGGEPAAGEPQEGGEEVLWEGRPSTKSLAGVYILAAVVVIADLYFLWGVQAIERGWLRVPLIWGLSVVLAGALAYVAYRFYGVRLAASYRLTSQRIFVSRGFFVRSTNELELVRVEDVGVRTTLLGRVFGIGDVRITSTDATDPELVIASIAEPESVKEKIRTGVRRLRGKAVFIERV
jgi:membrane protein YdbS with pleckstrin-like domain